MSEARETPDRPGHEERTPAERMFNFDPSPPQSVEWWMREAEAYRRAGWTETAEYCLRFAQLLQGLAS